MSSDNPRDFRPLNSLERQTIDAAVNRSRIPEDDPRKLYINHLSVSYERMQGGFTVCVLLLNIRNLYDEQNVKQPQNTTMWRGASRRSYKDPRKPVRGEMLAFSRAILYSRPVTL